MIHTLSIEYIVKTLARADRWETGHKEVILFKGNVVTIAKVEGDLPYQVEMINAKDSVIGWFAAPDAALTCVCNGSAMNAAYETIADVFRDCQKFLA